MIGIALRIVQLDVFFMTSSQLSVRTSRAQPGITAELDQILALEGIVMSGCFTYKSLLHLLLCGWSEVAGIVAMVEASEERVVRRRLVGSPSVMSPSSLAAGLTSSSS